MTDMTALTLQDVNKTFDISAPWLNRIIERRPKQLLHAVSGVSFSVKKGTCFSIVGESGCGKSTVARLVTGLYVTTSGNITFGTEQSGRKSRVQMIFQDPHSSVNPRWRIGDIIAEPIREMKLRDSEADVKHRVIELLNTVGLAADDAQKYPHEFSGGQRQRISIARALASEPDLLVCDEPTSALDVSVQAQILNLMRDLQEQLGLTYLFISHDLSVVRHMSDQIAVMYLGKIVEQASAEQIFTNPQHPYTKLLLNTIPNISAPKRRRDIQIGEPPSPLSPPTGCAFHPRCPSATDQCKTSTPALKTTKSNAIVACLNS